MNLRILYLGRRFSGGLIADSFLQAADELQLDATAVRLHREQVVDLLLDAVNPRRRHTFSAISIMFHPALVLIWMLVPRSARHYVIHDVRPHPGMKWRLYGLLDRWLANRSETVIALSEHSVREASVRLRSGARVVLVPHPPLTPADEPDPIDEMAAIGSQFFLFFGRMDAYKGADVLERLIPELRSRCALPIALVGVGVGKAVESLTGADRHNIVVVDRYVTENEVEWLVRQSSTILLPYSSATQSGVVERFAAGAGVPLGFDVGGLGDQLRSLDSRTVVAPDALDRFVDRAIELATNDALRAEVLDKKSERARRIHCEVVAQIASIFEE